MTKLTDYEIAKIFAKYPLCQTHIYDGDPKKGPVPDQVQGTMFINPVVYCEHTGYKLQLVKLILKALHHLDDAELLDLCRTFDNTPMMLRPIVSVQQKADDPAIKRIVCDCGKIVFVYHFNITNGNITLFKGGNPFTYSNNPVAATQWYYENYVAIPVFFEYGHWANDKTPFELGIAEPDRTLLYKLLFKKYDKDKEKVSDWFFNKQLEGLNLRDITLYDKVINELQ